MIKSEDDLKKKSHKMCVLGTLLFFAIAIILKNISVLFGFVLGALISLGILAMDCASATAILQMKFTKTAILQAMLLFFKMGIYALGFFIAVKIPQFINIFCVAIGYLTVKLTIMGQLLNKEVK